MLKFGELKEILSYEKGILVFDDDGSLRKTYSPAAFDASYDECNVYKLDFDSGKGAFLAYIEIPTWRVHGTITVDIEFEVKALSEEDAIEAADYIRAETCSYGEMRVTSYGTEIDSVYLGDVEFDWDGAEEDDC